MVIACGRGAHPDDMRQARYCSVLPIGAGDVILRGAAMSEYCNTHSSRFGVSSAKMFVLMDLPCGFLIFGMVTTEIDPGDPEPEKVVNREIAPQPGRARRK